MNWRRVRWFCLALALIGGVVAGWLVLAFRDADFHVVGPRTKGVRANFAKLDMMIDPAEYGDCKTMRDAVMRLNKKLEDPPIFEDNRGELFFWELGRGWLRVDEPSFKEILDAPYQPSSEVGPQTLKQFLRNTFARHGAPEVNFIVRGHYVEATTPQRADEERTQHLESLSMFDRMRTFWKGLTGEVPDDPPEMLQLNVW